MTINHIQSNFTTTHTATHKSTSADTDYRADSDSVNDENKKIINNLVSPARLDSLIPANQVTEIAKVNQLTSKINNSINNKQIVNAQDLAALEDGIKATTPQGNPMNLLHESFVDHIHSGKDPELTHAFKELNAASKHMDPAEVNDALLSKNNSNNINDNDENAKKREMIEVNSKLINDKYTSFVANQLLNLGDTDGIGNAKDLLKNGFSLIVAALVMLIVSQTNGDVSKSFIDQISNNQDTTKFINKMIELFQGFQNASGFTKDGKQINSLWDLYRIAYTGDPKDPKIKDLQNALAPLKAQFDILQESSGLSPNDQKGFTGLMDLLYTKIDKAITKLNGTNIPKFTTNAPDGENPGEGYYLTTGVINTGLANLNSTATAGSAISQQMSMQLNTSNSQYQAAMQMATQNIDMYKTLSQTINR